MSCRSQESVSLLFLPRLCLERAKSRHSVSPRTVPEPGTDILERVQRWRDPDIQNQSFTPPVWSDTDCNEVETTKYSETPDLRYVGGKVRVGWPYELRFLEGRVFLSHGQIHKLLCKTSPNWVKGVILLLRVRVYRLRKGLTNKR